MELRPGINDPITLRDADDREYLSRVEDLAPGVLTVARPLGLPVTHELEPGTDLLAAWKAPRGLAMLPVRLSEEQRDHGVRLWSLEVTGDGWVEQRRRFVRVPAAGPITLIPYADEPEPVTGSLVDLSEAALRCAVDLATADALVNDLAVLARFRFGDREFDLPSRIGFRRLGSHRTDLIHLVVLFDEPVGQADALRKEIFAQQRRALRG